MKTLLTIVYFALFTTFVQAQLVVNGGIPVNTLVTNNLLSPGVTVSNISFQGDPSQIGEFNSSSANVGLAQGVILATHDINDALGPNNTGGAGGGVGAAVNGDPDLAQVAGVTTGDIYDAVIIEFDFVPSGNTVDFNYVFGSEEYLEFVSAGVNDAFGFFLSGPGIAGPYSNGAENIALIPGTTTPITIDNVNDVTNSAYYVDNGDGFTAPFNSSPNYVQYDGLTVQLTATAQVTCGQTYHIKIALSDVGDDVWGSAVFLELGSFAANNAISFNYNTQDALCDGVDDGSIAISANGGVPPYLYSIDGGITFSPSFAFVNLSPGSYPIEVKDLNNCGVKSNSSAIVNALTTVNLTAAAQDISCFGSNDGSINLTASNGTSPYTYSIDNGGTFGNTNTFNALGAGIYPIIVEDDIGCIAKSIRIIDEPNELSVQISPDKCYEVNETVNLFANVSGGDGNYNYAWSNSGSGNLSSFNATTDEVVSITVTDGSGCSIQKSSKVKITPQVDFSADILDACAPAEITFTNSSNTTGSNNCLWKIGYDSEVFDECASSFTMDFEEPGTYDVSLSVVSSNGCSAQDTQLSYILIRPAAVAEFYYRPVTEISTIRNKARFFNTSIDADAYEWSIDGIVIDTIEEIQYEFPQDQAGVYEICLEASSALGGCDDSICQLVFVEQLSNVTVPNSFTPNGDGINDEFYPVMEAVIPDDYLFQVFNRWGDLVFDAQSLDDRWNGSFLGNAVADDVYTWKLNVRTIETRRIQSFIGHVTLMR
jgi:gliding motility-associated-like protein